MAEGKIIWRVVVNPYNDCYEPLLYAGADSEEAVEAIYMADERWGTDMTLYAQLPWNDTLEVWNGAVEELEQLPDFIDGIKQYYNNHKR